MTLMIFPQGGIQQERKKVKKFNTSVLAPLENPEQQETKVGVIGKKLKKRLVTGQDDELHWRRDELLFEMKVYLLERPGENDHSVGERGPPGKAVG